MDLRAPGAVLLISLYELGHQPQHLATPLGFLREAGFRPAALDLHAEPFDPERVRRARVIFVAAPMHTALRLGVRLLARAREHNPGARVAFYGLYAALNAEHLFSLGADAVLGGEYEEALLRLCQALDGTETASGLPEVPGVSTREKRRPPVLARLRFPRPARDELVPLGRYARFDPGDGSAPRVAGHAEASRGCRHRCRHCPIPAVYHGRFFVVPKDVVLADVAQQVGAGAEHISFGDPDFLNGPRHALAVARAVHQAFPRLTFDVTVKIEHVLRQRRLWPELARLGCRFVVSAVESLSPAVLELLQKGHGPADVEQALQVLRGAGIALRPSLLPFTPLSTLDDYLELLDFTERHDLCDHVDPVQFTIRLLVPPGSYLLQVPELAAHLLPLDAASFAYPWRHPDPRMDLLHEQAARRVAAAADRGEDPRLVVPALRELALGLAGRAPARELNGELRASQSRAPRLTEPWFC